LITHLKHLALNPIYILFFPGPLFLPLFTLLVYQLFVDVQAILVHHLFALILSDQPFNLLVREDS